MYDSLKPLILGHPKATWLTLGDGRFGSDAHYLESYGLDVLATDISTTKLEIGLKDGFIKKFQHENAEKLSFSDDSFDFVLCKESYHHFPRPAIALYEMIRVAKMGIVLIEPNDPTIRTHSHNRVIPSLYQLWLSIKNEIKIGLGKEPYYPPANYEVSGNYVYTISPRELEKVALGINLPTLAFKEQDDSYVKGIESESVSENGKLFRQIKKNIKNAERKSRLGLKHYGLLTSIIFKQPIDIKLGDLLKTHGYSIKELERNPYV